MREWCHMGAGHLFRTVRSPLEIGDRIFWKPPRPDQTRPNWGPDWGSPDQTRPDKTGWTGLDQTAAERAGPDQTGSDRPDWTEPDWNLTVGLPWGPVGLPCGFLDKELYKNQ